MKPLRLIATLLAALLLTLITASLGNSRGDSSTVGLWLKGPERSGTSHPRPLPLDVYRTPRGIEVVAAASPAPDSGVLIDVQLTTATRKRSGFLFATRETSTHEVWGSDALGETEHTQLVSAAVACLRAQQLDDMVTDHLSHGVLTHKRVLFTGYAMDLIFGMLACFVAWQLRAMLRDALNQQRPASSASLR